MDKIRLISIEYKEADRFHHRHDDVYIGSSENRAQHSILRNKYVSLTFAFKLRSRVWCVITGVADERAREPTRTLLTIYFCPFF